jgi:Fe-S cluster assembly scaffold protein SufB
MSAASPAIEPIKPARTTLPTDRYWKLDYAKIDLDGGSAPVPLSFTIDAAAIAAGVVLCTLAEARRSHPEALGRALESGITEEESRFTEAAAASGEGFFCSVPEGVRVEAPLRIEIPGSSRYRGLILVGRGASIALIEALAVTADDALLCGLVEIVIEERATCEYTVLQYGSETARSFVTRHALVAADGALRFAAAELGGAISQSRMDARLAAPGARSEISVVAFAARERYLDLADDLDHAAPNTTSNTMIKAAAIARGRVRYYGNIRIAPRAHGADAILRDDALLLSPEAHIDSVPALEIAANDVRAFHGATVSNVDAEERFYAMSRGLSQSEADRLITLGFFEPAIARFPGEADREFVRSQLAAQLHE